MEHEQHPNENYSHNEQYESKICHNSCRVSVERVGYNVIYDFGES